MSSNDIAVAPIHPHLWPLKTFQSNTSPVLFVDGIFFVQVNLKDFVVFIASEVLISDFQ